MSSNTIDVDGYIIINLVVQDDRTGAQLYTRSFNDQALEVICNLDDPQTERKDKPISYDTSPRLYVGVSL